MRSEIFTVTRQHRWHDGLKIVEVSQGGIDYTNPDALCKKWQGEFEPHVGLTPAVEAAIGIAKAWQETTTDTVYIAVGCTEGMTAEFDAMPLTDETFDTLLEKAEKFDARLSRCEWCGDILTGKTYGTLMHGYCFCSQNCAHNACVEEMAEEEV